MNNLPHFTDNSSSLSIWILAIRIYRLVWLAVWFAVAIGLIVLVQNEIFKAVPTAAGWLGYLPSFIIFLIYIPLIVIFAGIGFWIFKLCESLLEKYRNDPRMDFSSQRECVVLKRLFVAQFIVNIYLTFSPWSKPVHMNQEKFARAAIEHPSLLAGFEKIEQTLGYLQWITVPLDKSMPLIYLAVLVVFMRLKKKNQVLEREFEQIV